MINDKPINASINSGQRLKVEIAQKDPAKQPAVSQKEPAVASGENPSETNKVAISAGSKPEVNASEPKTPSPAVSEQLKEEIREKVSDAIPKVRELMQKNQRSLDFEIAESENRVIITVIDKETNQIIRQIPPEDFLKVAEAIQQGDQSMPEGLILNFKA